MKNIIKYTIHRLLIAIARGSAAFPLVLSAHVAVADAGAELIPPYILAASAYCANELYSDGRSAQDCARSDKLALNSFSTAVDWEYGPTNVFSYSSDASGSNSVISTKTLSANGAYIPSSAQPDSSVLTDVTTAAPNTSLALEEGVRGDSETGESTISEPLLTSILALIAIVAVARRNVSGV